MTPLELVENVLLGKGVEVSNINYTGHNQAIGQFNGSSSNINLDQGIILSTGSVLDHTDGFMGAKNGPVGPNNNASATQDWSLPGDDELSSLINGDPTYDAVILEFDFVPQGDTIEFEYVFASEEYPEYVFSGFNDVFAFFISGPGISSPKNLAVVPGTNDPISINQINETTNASLYVTNGDGMTEPQFSNPTVVNFDGFTVPLKAIARVTPCETYHLRIAMADGGDEVYDSGVFLKGGSLNSNSDFEITQETSIDIGTPNGIIEDCSYGTVNITRTKNIANSYTINYRILGSAVNGVDYSSITNSATFSSGEETISIQIEPLLDNLNEGDESVVLRFPNPDICVLSDSSDYEFIIKDKAEPLESNPDTVMVCNDETVTLKLNYSG